MKGLIFKGAAKTLRDSWNSFFITWTSSGQLLLCHFVGQSALKSLRAAGFGGRFITSWDQCALPFVCSKSVQMPSLTSKPCFSLENNTRPSGHIVGLGSAWKMTHRNALEFSFVLGDTSGQWFERHRAQNIHRGRGLWTFYILLPNCSSKRASLKNFFASDRGHELSIAGLQKWQEKVGL